MIYQKGSNLFNVAIYIRLSREDGDKEESDSVGNQRKLLTEYVNKHDDFILYDVYIVVDMELKGLIREALIKMILGFDIALEIEEE